MDQMPQISYNRNHKNSYMIIEGDAGAMGYEEQMLRQNEITALLIFYAVEADKRIQLWYEISGKRSMRTLVEQEGLTVEKLRMILGAMYTSIKGVRNYLIPDEHLYLSRDTVFFEKSAKNWEAYLCWCPFPLPSAGEQIRIIMEFLMKSVEKERGEVSDLCRRLYEKSLEEVSLEQLVEIAALYHGGGSCDDEEEPEDEGFGYESADTILQAEAGSLEGSRERKLLSLFKGREKTSLPTSDRTLSDRSFSDRSLSDRSLSDRMSGFGQNIRDRINRLLGRSPAGTSPRIPDEGLIVFEPDADYHEPTTLIRTDDREFMGELVYEGSGSEANYLIDKDIFNIGSRSEDNDANLNSPVVSRHHARITRDDSGYYIEDLNSTNGTYVNDKILSFEEKVRLNRADRIRFADVTYRII